MKAINSRQLSFILFLYILGSALLNIPESVIGRDVYFSTAIASLLGFYILYMIISIQEMYPNLNILQVAELTLGKIGGKILNLFYIWTLFLLTTLILFDIVLFLQLLYPRTPDILITTVVMLCSCYVLFQGITNIGRLGDITIFPMVILIILGFAVSLSLFKFYNILPMFADIKPVLGGSIYAAYWPFTQIIAFAMLLPFVVDLPTKKNLIYYGYIIGSIVLIIRSFITLGVLGSNLMKISHFPFYDIFLLLRFQDFQRVELFFFALFVTLVLTVLIVAHGALTLAVQSFFKLKNNLPLIIPIGLFIIALAYNMFPSSVNFFATQSASVIFFILPINILYPFIIYIAAKIKVAKEKQVEGVRSGG